MQIKKFTAENFAEALQQVKKVFGEEALILGSRTLPGQKKVRGYPGVPERVEITAAMELPAAGKKNAAEAPRKATSAAVAVAPEEPGISILKEETESDFKGLIRTLLSGTERAKSIGLKDHQMELFGRLLGQGVNERFAARLFEKLNATAPDKRKARDDGEELQGLMRRLIRDAAPAAAGKLQRRLALLGPTGSGKTTTLAKLAARHAIAENKKVALITIDTYRIGAVDQLRMYGDIMRLPVETASDAGELRRIVARHADKDILLLDTTGRNHRDKEYPRQLREMFRAVPDLEVHLVLSATTQEKVCEETFRQFEGVGIHRLLFTKLDEAVCYGSLFNFALRTQKPMSYFATGQRVPEDLEVADRDKVIRLIFN